MGYMGRTGTISRLTSALHGTLRGTQKPFCVPVGEFFTTPSRRTSSWANCLSTRSIQDPHTTQLVHRRYCSHFLQCRPFSQDNRSSLVFRTPMSLRWIEICAHLTFKTTTSTYNTSCLEMAWLKSDT